MSVFGRYVADSATCPCTINLGWYIVYIEGAQVIFPSNIQAILSFTEEEFSRKLYHRVLTRHNRPIKANKINDFYVVYELLIRVSDR